MLFRSHRIMLSSLMSLLVAGCGGGGGAASNFDTSTSTSTTMTTVSSTTSTTASAQSETPPLATTKTPLLKGAGAQTLGTPAWTDQYNGGTGTAIGNANCEDWNQPRNYFAHAHVSIFKDGERLAVPQFIGWRDDCIYDINTDSRNGVIDALSSTGYKYFTLGELFRIWGQPLSRENVAGITGLPVVIYINDNEVLRQYMGDPANIELASYRSITIQIGAQLSEVPTYDWSAYTGSYE